MKRLILASLAALALDAFAQHSASSPTVSGGGDRVDVVDVEQLPLPPPPGAIEKLEQPGVVAPDGFSTIETSPRTVSAFVDMLMRVRTLADAQRRPGHGAAPPTFSSDVSGLRLTFRPAGFDNGQFIGATTEGATMGDAWTGLSRYFRIPGAGEACLAEADLASSRGRFYMLKKSVNGKVNGKPAISKIFLGDGGAVVEQIVWVSGTKLYMLTYLPMLLPANNTKAEAGVSAFSLAQAVRE